MTGAYQFLHQYILKSGNIVFTLSALLKDLNQPLMGNVLSMKSVPVAFRFRKCRCQNCGTLMMAMSGIHPVSPQTLVPQARPGRGK